MNSAEDVGIQQGQEQYPSLAFSHVSQRANEERFEKVQGEYSTLNAQTERGSW